jgi:hypothetical protein
MKISDLDDKEKLENYKVDLRPLKGTADENSEFVDEGYIISAWNRGIWVKKDKTDNRFYPIFVDMVIDSHKILDLEIIK